MAKVLDICGLQHLLEQLLNHAVNRAPFAFHLVDMVPAVNSPYPACTTWKTEFADEIVNCLTPLISGQDVIAKISNSRIAVIQKERLGQRGADALAVKMRSKLASPENAEWLNVRCLIGTVEIAERSESPQSLMAHAEQAVTGTNSAGACVFTNHKCPRLLAQGDEIAVANTLLDALENDQFELFYQPILSSKTLEVAQLEALIRWRHPSKCYIHPNQFIPAAERTGAIVKIGKWALETACREILAKSPNVEVAVNTSAVEFMASDVSQSVERALEETGLYPRRLTIELTETVLLSHSEQLLRQLHRIRDMGVKISVDDFGSGYSSLAYVHTLPIDSIKLDRSFIQYLNSSNRSRLVIDGVLRIARDLKLATVAEGIETKCEADIMRNKGVTYVQGYYFGRPAPPSEVYLRLESPVARVQ